MFQKMKRIYLRKNLKLKDPELKRKVSRKKGKKKKKNIN